MSSLETPPAGEKQTGSKAEVGSEQILNPGGALEIAEQLLQDRERSLQRRFNVGQDARAAGAGIVFGMALYAAHKILGTGEVPVNMDTIALASVAGAAINAYGGHISDKARGKLEALRERFSPERNSTG